MKDAKFTFTFDAAMTVGSHRLSLESINKNTASCSSMSFSSFLTSALALAKEAGLFGIGWPGIGMASA
jgi:hypothetical protein